MNVLKEMGIQQWRRRTALPVSNENHNEKPQHHRAESSDVTSPLLSDENTNVTVFSDNSSAPMTQGPAGSLRQALESPKLREPQQDKVGNDALQKPSSLDTLVGQPPAMQSTQAEQEPIAEQKLEVKKTSGNQSDVKTITPLDISELLVADDVLEESFNSDGATVDHFVTNEVSQPQVNDLQSDTADESIIELFSELDWSGLQARIDTNEHCPSCGWGNGLLGSGNQSADWMFVIDAPNSKEIEAKAFFSGRAGQLFEAMLLALGLDRNSVYCSSIFKCAPTDDLSMTPQCEALVLRQIELVSPKVIISFGEFASQALLKSNSMMEVLRGSEQRCFRTQKMVVPTYTPQDMLDDSALKAKVWGDLKKAMHLTTP